MQRDEAGTGIERLEALAKAATPGPYRYTEDTGHDGPPACDDLLVQALDEDIWQNLLAMDWDEKFSFTRAQSEANARMFAACDPDTILSLISAARERDALRAALIELHAVVKGECPSLLDEDSGGSARLALQVDDAIATSKPAEEQKHANQA